MKIHPFETSAQGSFKWQIILTFVVGFFVLAVAFAVYQVRTESAYLYRDSTDETMGMAESLAASSRSWVLAYDLNGMQEVVRSFKNHPEVRYAMIISPSGQVLAHTDATKVGQFVTDEASQALIKSQPVNRTMIDDESISDIASPIMMDQRHVGWARVAKGREGIAGNLHSMILSSVLFVLSAVILSLLAAQLIASRLGYRIGYLMRVAEAVQAGNYATRANISGVDEIARLANSLNHMLDVLAEDVAERRKAESALRELNNDFVTLLESTGDYIYFKDKDSRIRFCSQTLANITGHPSWRDMIGKHDLEIFPQDVAKVYYEEELPIFQEGKVLLNKTDPYYDAQGNSGWVNTNKWPVFGDDKKSVVGIFGISRDITELKLAEDTITELNRDLEQRVVERTEQLAAANKELEAFSYSVSHDLRTPLRAIDGFSQILLDDYTDKLDDEGKRLLNVVRDNTHRMGRLIEDILKFSRTSRLEMSFSKVDMQGVARAVYAELQPVGDNVQVEIDAIPPATCDRATMHQVFVNLLSNAIKFSRAKSPAVIKVGGTIKGAEAVYFVRDNGAGFDMKYADKLFGVFQRLHAMSEFEGTGIGLAIVKRIVTRHGGRVWAEGTPNAGATIYFALPIRDALSESLSC